MNGIELIERKGVLHVGVVAEGEHLPGLVEQPQPEVFRKVAVLICVPIAEIFLFI